MPAVGPAEWSVADVCEWLEKDLQLPASVAQEFRANAVAGAGGVQYIRLPCRGGSVGSLHSHCAVVMCCRGPYMRRGARAACPAAQRARLAPALPPNAEQCVLHQPLVPPVCLDLLELSDDDLTKVCPLPCCCRAAQRQGGSAASKCPGAGMGNLLPSGRRSPAGAALHGPPGSQDPQLAQQVGVQSARRRGPDRAASPCRGCAPAPGCRSSGTPSSACRPGGGAARPSLLLRGGRPAAVPRHTGGHWGAGGAAGGLGRRHGAGTNPPRPPRWVGCAGPLAGAHKLQALPHCPPMPCLPSDPQQAQPGPPVHRQGEAVAGWRAAGGGGQQAGI